MSVISLSGDSVPATVLSQALDACNQGNVDSVIVLRYDEKQDLVTVNFSRMPVGRMVYLKAVLEAEMIDGIVRERLECK